MAHVFLQPFALPVRAGNTTMGILRTADDGANVEFKVKYWKTSAGEASATTTAALAAETPAAAKRLIHSLSGLEANTHYSFKIIENLNAGGDDTLARTGTFTTLTDANNATVCGAIIGDIHHGNETVAGSSAEALQDVDSVADVLVSRGAQIQVYGGDDVNNVAKAYITGATSADIAASIETAHVNYFEVWERPLSLAPVYRMIGNHELMGCGWYGNVQIGGVDAYQQQYSTENHKRFFGNPATDIGEAAAEWADPDDVTAEEAWVTGENLPPFETQFTIRHGPVLLVSIDSERYGDITSTDPEAASVATLGASQIAWAREQAAASDAIYKVLLFHRPSGGLAPDNAVAEAYRRGQPAAVGTKDDYEFGESYFPDELEDVFDAAIGFHDHVTCVAHLKRNFGTQCLSGGSPTAPFTVNEANRAGRGYATSTDWTVDYYFEGRGIWVYDADNRRLRFRWVRTVNDDRDATLDEVGYEFQILPKPARTFYGANGVHWGCWWW